MRNVKVTFKKLPELGKLVQVLDGELQGMFSCTECELSHTKTGVNCHSIYSGSCIGKHWGKAKP